MERLTEECWRDFDVYECCGQWGYCKRDKPTLKVCTSDCIIPKLYRQLAKYEDIGLSPNEVKALKYFKEYFDELYGEGLEIANWHLNGDLEPFDNFYDSAVDGGI